MDREERISAIEHMVRVHNAIAEAFEELTPPPAPPPKEGLHDTIMRALGGYAPSDTLASLKAKYAMGRLSLEEFEKRIEVILRVEEAAHGYE